MAINMGLGKIGQPNVVHKRKFRWTFEVERTNRLSVPASFVKMAARPNISIEETEIHFLNGKTYIPGKGTWEAITVTYYDVAGSENLGLWEWLADVYNYTNPIALTQSSRRECYSGRGKCKLYDGCGNALESWTLDDCWPQAVNFQELDYASSDEMTIEVTIRYANVTYANLCGASPGANCCGCTAYGNSAAGGEAVN